MAMVGAFELAFTKMHQKRCYKILCALYEYIGWLVFLQNVHVFGSRRVPECRSSKCSMSSHLSFHIWNKPYKSQQNRPEKKILSFLCKFFRFESLCSSRQSTQPHSQYKLHSIYVFLLFLYDFLLKKSKRNKTAINKHVA